MFTVNENYFHVEMGRTKMSVRNLNLMKESTSVQFSRLVVSNSLRPHESQHSRPPCPSPTPGVYSNSCPLSRWCHPAISSSVTPFSSCPQSLPASGSFPMSHLFYSTKLVHTSFNIQWAKHHLSPEDTWWRTLLTVYLAPCDQQQWERLKPELNSWNLLSFASLRCSHPPRIPDSRTSRSTQLFTASAFPNGGTRGKESACKCRRHKRCRFDPWVGKSPWRAW